MTVKEISKLSGVSVRTLHHYDNIGLLRPSRSPSGYRQYTQKDLERLQLILFFRELQFPLKDIPIIIDAPDFDRTRALEQQVELLTLQKKHLENLIMLAQYAGCTGVKHITMNKADYEKMDDYVAQARAMWGNTPAYQEYLDKAKGRGKDEEESLNDGLMDIFIRMGRLEGKDPAADEAQSLVKELQEFITAHFYTCTPQILRGLGQMYAGGGSFTENIDSAAGAGTARFAHQAIEIYCQSK
ncbi:MAG: MerR family transcriptional regulator [Oscillospiraceae bacterium]|nr:MerR family transcriptional regulator [Oscillospiraceae bacterium]